MKTPRRGSAEEERALKSQQNVIPADSQLPLVTTDPFGSDYLNTLSDINEVFTEDPIIKGGFEGSRSLLH